MPSIYISYSRQDLKTAKEVSALLLQCGYKTFLDIEDFPPGSAYAQHLISQLKTSDLVVFIVSETSLNSQWCQREIDYALSIGKGILPIAVSHNVRSGTDSEFYNSRLSSLRRLVWDSQGKRELPSLLKSLLPPVDYAPRPSSAPPLPKSTKK